LADVKAKGNQITDAVSLLIEEAHAGSPGALIRVDALLAAGLQFLLKPSNLCGLQVTDIDLGTQVSFTIPKGMSGRAVIDLIEKANPRSPRSPQEGVVSPSSALLKDSGLNDTVSEDTKYTFVVCTKANFRTRGQHDTYLAENGLDSVPRWVLTVGAALFRDQKGFPTDRSNIGTAQDEGDLFKGQVVRARSGAVASHDHRGLDERDCLDGGDNGWVVVAGVPLPNQKS